MRIILIFVFIFLLNLPMILGQCSGKLIFLTQNDLNEFFSNNSCDHLDTVRIGPNSSDSFDCDITSLAPLLGVRKINNLSFGTNCPLENLNGLDSVKS